MSQQNEAVNRSYLSNTALEPRRLVVLNASRKLAYNTAGATLLCTGVTQGRATAADKNVTIRDRKAAGTHVITASVAIAVGDPLYAAANGKVTNVLAGTVLGRALEAASGDNSEFEAELF